ncbi:hypothetical protein QF043_004628 [Pseudomonas sp. W3I7]|uniref:hypothetical protein n=1 Tax=Pseudomonas sp. W3I7 TaxID=3042292 RepID=UPI00278EAD14|nr:hypothetical protein [Pseudomonas sp. W3I7]MDQ0705836.1 hypothetical protein [Pseudomonas sp. W3I7]
MTNTLNSYRRHNPAPPHADGSSISMRALPPELLALETVNTNLINAVARLEEGDGLVNQMLLDSGWDTVTTSGCEI